MDRLYKIKMDETGRRPFVPLRLPSIRMDVEDKCKKLIDMDLSPLAGRDKPNQLTPMPPQQSVPGVPKRIIRRIPTKILQVFPRKLEKEGHCESKSPTSSTLLQVDDILVQNNNKLKQIHAVQKEINIVNERLTSPGTIISANDAPMATEVRNWYELKEEEIVQNQTTSKFRLPEIHIRRSPLTPALHKSRSRSTRMYAKLPRLKPLLRQPDERFQGYLDHYQ